jgi:hypothetical protein
MPRHTVVCDETITAVELTGPFAELRALRDAIHGIVSASPRPEMARVLGSPGPEDAKTPPLRGNGGLWANGSISDVMVELAGLEPATSWVRFGLVGEQLVLEKR